MSKEEKRMKKEEEKLVKEKKKIKKKPLIILTIILIILVTLGCLGYYIISQNNKKEISKHYSQYVVTTKKTDLFDKNNKKIGTVEKEVNLELENKIVNKEYYKIKDTEYYLYYKDMKKSNKPDEIKINENYLIYNYNVETKDKTTLYKADKPVIKLNTSLSIPIQYMDSANYYVLYLGSLYAIPKNSNEKVVKAKNTEEQEAKFVSVLYYYEVQNECNNFNCTKTEDMKNQINKLKENGFYTITTQEFKDFVLGNIQLKDKAIYITTSNPNDNTSNIANELNVLINLEESTYKFVKTNKPAVKENVDAINKYQVKSYTPVDNVLRMANGEEVIEEDPAPPKDQAIAVLNYHFFYDPNQGETCDEGICLTTDKFREHLQYLKDNGYKTLRMNEFMRWMYGEIELPEKSVLITIDDGAMGTGKHNGNKLIPLLEEYDMYATLFLITGWWDISNYQSSHLDIQSHTNDMHQYGDCGRGQLVCYSYDKAKADLEQSVAIIGNLDSFCYPFYSYSDTAIQAVKDVGFKIAFAGGNVKATRKSNKWLIPRYPIHSNITLDQFKAMVG